MKLEQLVGERFKERPSDCEIESHALMLRGGYMKNVAGGIFSSYLPLRRITRKIEAILREEMDAVDGQEVQFPVVLPASLWEQSGRFESVGSELMRFEDRSGTPLVLGMTHEEAAVHLVREYAQTYTRYPFMIYQIQTKFRDEARPRAGLIRVREFTMKDAYSFHTSQEDLEDYYARCHQAYENVYRRAGLSQVVSVASDSGMMGGSVSHEFMLLTPVGEDSIATCTACDYRANMEAAAYVAPPAGSTEAQALTLCHTPGTETIEDVCNYLQLPQEQSCKAVVYQKNSDDSYVVLFIRGDLEVNLAKLTRFLGEDVYPATLTDDCGLVKGYIGPYGLAEGVTALYDSSLASLGSLCAGANQPDHHYTGLNLGRDVGDVEYGDFAKVHTGGICPKCGKPALEVVRGIEVGNIFQLGTKYTESMGMTYVDAEGESHYPIMGCYGIGVGRLAASVAEVSRDDYGPIWPISIAPWQVHLCCLRADDAEVKQFADELYKQLMAEGLEVIYDDRDVRPGVMFSDADLLGVPVRVVASPRNLKEGCCELVTRDKTVSKKVPVADIVAEAKQLVQELLAKLQ